MENYTQHIRWTPGIGDPSFVGWLTVALYFIVALYCYRVYSSRDIIFDTNKAQQNAFWLFLTIAFFGIRLNWVMEICSILLVGLNARLLLKAQKVTCPTTEQ